MLVELDIKNFAIIKTLKVRFQEKMTVLIGETGAGKSIIIDAVSLLLGSRAQSEMIRSGEEKAVITGLFVLSEQKDLIEDLCEKYGLPFEDDQLIISRELTHKGRNVVRINGQLTTINVLREIGRNLVDIHGQNDQQILMDQDRQIDLIDNYAEPEFKKELHSYKVDFEKWRHLTSQLRKLREDAQEIAQKQDILEFQNNELESADLNDPNEDEKLEEEFNELNNYQKIADTANYFMQLYDDDEHGLATLLGDAQNAAEDLSNYGKKFENFATSLNDGIYSLNDARSELSTLMDQMDFDEERYQYVSSRLDTLNTLKKKYGPTLDDVFKFAQKVKSELNKFETGDLDEGKIQKELAIIEKSLSQKAQNLHEQREKIARDLEEKIKKELADLYMEKARFSIRINETNSFTKLGTDEVIFMIAPNPGEALMPLVKIVSGGEQSRLILALKAIFSRVEPVGTMIFDEIDTGVSGRVSAAIGKKMHLTQEEAITAIAQMMAGSDVTDAAKRNAADLMESFKE